jgi:hypothetical protein
MKLAEFMQKPLLEALLEMNLVDAKIHTNNSGNVVAIELKYSPTGETAENHSGAIPKKRSNIEEW